jgi:hypothetical protein
MRRCGVDDDGFRFASCSLTPWSTAAAFFRRENSDATTPWRMATVSKRTKRGTSTIGTACSMRLLLLLASLVSSLSAWSVLRPLQRPVLQRSATVLSANNRGTDSWKPPSHWKFTGFRHKQSGKLIQSSSPTALMPDGGLSPCVIKVIGVGGGGCNAVDRMLDTAVGEFNWSVQLHSAIAINANTVYLYH